MKCTENSSENSLLFLYNLLETYSVIFHYSAAIILIKYVKNFYENFFRT